MKRYITPLLLCCLLAFVLVLTSCSRTGMPSDSLDLSPPVLGEKLDETKKVTLKILTEDFLWSQPPIGKETKDQYKLKENISEICDYYESEHPNVQIDLEIIPSAQDTRNTTIQQRRVELLSGKTPDIYLLPTMSCDLVYSSRDYPLLFNDVQQAMTNNWFADISAYYDADEDLRKEELQSQVMDAGVMDGKRFVLPLGYSLGLVVADKEELDKTNLADVLYTHGTQGYMNASLEGDELKWALERGVSLNWFLNFFPTICDYQNETVLVKQEDISSAMQLYVHFWKAGMSQFSGQNIVAWSSIDEYLHGVDEFFINNTTPVSFEPIEGIVDILSLSQVYEKELTILPLRASDGGIIADVTFWGAISPNCENIDYAYDFLRTFLTSEVQHGEPLVASDTTQYSTSFPLEITPGWPVRNHGFLKKRWDYIKEKNGFMESTNERERKLAEVQLDDDDLSVLDETISQVRFPSVLDRMINQIFSPALYEDTSDEEISKMASTLIRDMKYHLAEG